MGRSKKEVKMTHYKLDCPICGEFLDTEFMPHDFVYLDEQWQFIHKDCYEIFRSF